MENDINNLSRAERRMQERETRKRGERPGGNGFGFRLALWGGLVVIIALIVWMAVTAAKRPQPAAITALADPVTASDWSLGNPEAPFTLVEYSDFQCPACALYAPLVERLPEDFPDQVRLVYRHFPLKQIHPNAVPSARAAEAAGRQGKFWEMSRLIFAKQDEWASEPNAQTYFEQYAQSLGLNLTQFREDYDSATVNDKIEADLAGGLRSGVDATPSFFLNGERIENPRSYEDFAALLASSTAATSTNETK